MWHNTIAYFFRFGKPLPVMALETLRLPFSMCYPLLVLSRKSSTIHFGFCLRNSDPRTMRNYSELFDSVQTGQGCLAQYCNLSPL